MKVTSINKPMKRCTMWWGTAIDGDKNYEWFYNPRGRLCVREEESGIPGCFMNIEPAHGARRKIVRAVRAAKGCGLRPRRPSRLVARSAHSRAGL
jgi:hypothetical protein